MHAHHIKIGIDVGGTFTDFVLVESASRIIHHKQPSTPQDPSQAVLDGFDAVVSRIGVRPEDVRVIAHGTTIGLNAIIQARGARTGLVVSRGNRDILQIGRCKIPDPLNIFSHPSPALVRREHVIESELRINRIGNCRPILDSDIDVLAGSFREHDVEAAAVVLTNAYLRPEVEVELADRLAERLGYSVTASCDIWPEIREYERAVVAVMNAYITPLMNRYLSSVEEGLAKRGFSGRLLITTSNGGILPVSLAYKRPVDTLLSGPAAGVVAAAHEARNRQQGGIITVDVGGTSSDMSVITDGQAESSNRAHISGYPMFMPVVSVSAIGAGGGSIVHVDDFGVLKVGPDSAGANPGPICYGRGGIQPTITDCYLVCGFLSPDQRLGGSVRLSIEAARKALALIGGRLGYDPSEAAEQTAWAAIRIATAKMATELRKGLAERGLDQNSYRLVPFGGAGPVQAALLAEEAGLKAVSIPSAPGTYCAMGAVTSDLKRDFARTIRKRLDGSLSSHLISVRDALLADARQWLEGERDIVRREVYEFKAAMRYQGQSYELWLSPDEDLFTRGDEAFIEAFHLLHQHQYGFSDSKAAVEIMLLQLTAIGQLDEVAVETSQSFTSPVADGTTRRVYFGQWMEAAVREREKLPPGTGLMGPAIISQRDTTSIIPIGWFGQIERNGTLVLMRNNA
jgi:N-methylhydantoinase A